MKPEGKVYGDKSLIKLLKSFPEDLRNQAVTVGTREAAKVIKNDAIMYAPYDTGNLRSNIAYSKISKRWTKRLQLPTEAINYAVYVKPDAFYGRFIELGTKFIAPDPFLFPALVTNQYKSLRIIKDKIKSDLPKIVKKYVDKKAK